MESKSPSQAPNGSVGAGARPADPPPRNGDRRLPQSGAERVAGAVAPPPSKPTENNWESLRQRYHRYSEDASRTARQAYDSIGRGLRSRSAAVVQQATGRPLGLRQLRALEPAREPAAGPQDEPEPGYAVVVLERDDSLPAICGKLDAAKLPRVAVLVPRGNIELSTEVGVRLLLRHADWAGKEIVLVTRRPSIRQMAHAEGLRYVGSLQRLPFARRTRSLLGGLELPVPAISTVAWLAGGFATLAIIAFVLLWYLPSATVTLYPPTAQVSQEQSLSLDPIANRVDAVNDVVPGDRRSVSVTRTVMIPATGSANVEQTAGDPVTVPAVSDADLKTAQDLAAAALTDQALQELNGRDGGAWMYFPQTAKVDVQSVDPRRKVGAATSFLEVRYMGTVSILGAKQSDVRDLILPSLRGKVAAGKQVIDSSEQLTVEKGGPYDVTVDRLPLVMRLDAATSNQVDVAKIQQALRGKNKRQALEYAAQAVEGVREPGLHLSPGWVPWLPHFTGRLHVDLAARG